METIILLIIAYLLGSIPNGLWLGKLFYHKDIRNFGSHNIGATNALRTLGVTPGIIVMLLDIAKGSLATVMPIYFNTILWNSHFTMLLYGLMAIIGHTASIFDHFHGGKAVATSAGMLLIYSWPLFLYCLSMMIIITFLTSMVSLASLISFTTVTVIIFFLHDWFLFPLAVLLTMFVFYKHRTNLVRIFNHNENLVHFGINYWHHKSN